MREYEKSKQAVGTGEGTALRARLSKSALCGRSGSPIEIARYSPRINCPIEVSRPAPTLPGALITRPAAFGHLPLLTFAHSDLLSAQGTPSPA